MRRARRVRAAAQLHPRRNAEGSDRVPARSLGLHRQRMREVLRACGLGAYAGSLLDADRWSDRFSGGEQQRVAFARVLLARPSTIFLDECTSALDPQSEHHLYQLLIDRLPHATVLSVAHRKELQAFHQQTIDFSPKPQAAAWGRAPAGRRPRIRHDAAMASRRCRWSVGKARRDRTCKQESEMSSLKSVTEASFEADVTLNSRPVLIDFWRNGAGRASAGADARESGVELRRQGRHRQVTSTSILACASALACAAFPPWCS
nr:ATP-binding cassette domain-containing protein [Burkholderia glumae]